jgi:tRNA pseudouridine38-40 synthase
LQQEQQAVKRKNEQLEGENKNKKNKQGRGWGGARSRDRNVDSRPEGDEAIARVEKEERRPKKKVACFIGYSGEGYHGMQ